MAGRPGSADRIPRLTKNEAELEMARVNSEGQRAEIARLNARIDSLKSENEALKAEIVAREDDNERIRGERDVLAQRILIMENRRTK